MFRYDWPPEARVATTNWSIYGVGGFAISFPTYGASIGVWQFRNLDNGYAVRMLLGDQSLGLRAGFGVKGLSDLVMAIIAGASSAVSEQTSLDSHFTVMAPFAATELVMARIARVSRGVTAGISFSADHFVVRPALRDRVIFEFDGMAMSLTPALELNGWSSGEGHLYFPV